MTDKDKAAEALRAAGFPEAANVKGVVTCQASTPAEQRKAKKVLRDIGYSASYGFTMLTGTDRQ